MQCCACRFRQQLICDVEERSVELAAYGITCRSELVRTLTRCRVDHERCSKRIDSCSGRVHPASQCEIRRRTNRSECSRSCGHHDLMIPHVRCTCGDALNPGNLVLTSAFGGRRGIVSTVFVMIRPSMLTGDRVTSDDVCSSRAGSEYISCQEVNSWVFHDLEIID